MQIRIRRNFWPDWLYCWLFEHDDVFVHDEEPVAQQHWCQRCFVALPPMRERVSVPA